MMGSKFAQIWFKLPMAIRQKWWRDTSYGVEAYKVSDETCREAHAFITQGEEVHPTQECGRYECTWWRNQVVRVGPRLVRREGFWVCPFCLASAGTLTDENFNPAVLDSEP